MTHAHTHTHTQAPPIYDLAIKSSARGDLCPCDPWKVELYTRRHQFRQLRHTILLIVRGYRVIIPYAKHWKVSKVCFIPIYIYIYIYIYVVSPMQDSRWLRASCPEAAVSHTISLTVVQSKTLIISAPPINYSPLRHETIMPCLHARQPAYCTYQV